MELIFSTSGTCRCVYSEDMDLSSLGTLNIQRGSHVEPNDHGQWTADMAPVNGPVLGPFPNRSAALQAEVAWLHEFWLMSPDG